eukprot:TRINITY_DN25680_c0_g1_i1.p1 TRINITY_DN25680_c0_g1~~TRINITY_DN25680_c0_g1_i1.p1  ORF type:complete len:209 (+),score=13.26 TRINITY_DN25680_c0_g1_i1:34-660(+)
MFRVLGGAKSPLSNFKKLTATQARWVGVTTLHMFKGRGMNITGRTSVMHNTRIQRIPGMKNAGTFINLGPMGTNTFIGVRSFESLAESPYKKYGKERYPRLLGQEYQKAIVNKLMIKKPRRPNSGKVLACSVSFRKPSFRTGEPVATRLHAHIGVKSTPLREYSVVQVGKKHKRGLTTKYFCKWGKYDFPAKVEARMQLRKFEGKMGY